MDKMAIDDKAKRAAALKAAELIHPGMNIGLGTGSTVKFLIERLGELRADGLQFSVFPTSLATETLARTLAIPLLNVETVDHLDLTIDGADEIDGEKNLIKGGGGALLREKITAVMANEMVVIASEEKLVKRLGTFPLPVEILPFGAEATLKELKKFPLTPKIRMKGKSPYITDNGNWIADLHLQELLSFPGEFDRKLKEIPGVLATGLFTKIAGRVFIGHADGSVTLMP